MAIEEVDLGVDPSGEGGDSPRAGFEKVNKAIKELSEDASTTQKGRVQLNDTLDTPSDSQALTAAQGSIIGNLLRKAGILDLAANNHVSDSGPIQKTTDIAHNGFYRIAAQDATNTTDTWPNQTSGDALINAQWAKGYGFQLGSAKSINSLYFRTASSNNYKGWVKIIGEVDVVDNLIANVTNRPLSANQGRILNETKLGKNEVAISASTLATARSVSFSGAATGSFKYNGGANSSCVLTLANSGVTANTYGSTLKIPVITVNAEGVISTATTQDIPTFSGSSVGLVPLSDGSTTKFLRGDGVWIATPNTNTTYAVIPDAEMKAGTAATARTISAKVLKDAVAYFAPTPDPATVSDATETTKGVAQIATVAQAQALTDDESIITPKKLKDALSASGSAPISACRAWGYINGLSSVLVKGGNIESITRASPGIYTIYFSKPMPNTDYAIFGMCMPQEFGADNAVYIIREPKLKSRTTTSVSVVASFSTGQGNVGLYYPPFFSIGVFC